MFRRVLICDDQKISASILKEMIFKNGEYVVMEKENLEEALELVREKKQEEKEFDFIIISITLGKENLYQFLENILDEGYEGELALAGAMGLEDDVIQRALSLKVRKFLTKPYKEDEIGNFL